MTEKERPRPPLRRPKLDLGPKRRLSAARRTEPSRERALAGHSWLWRCERGWAWAPNQVWGDGSRERRVEDARRDTRGKRGYDGCGARAPPLRCPKLDLGAMPNAVRSVEGPEWLAGRRLQGISVRRAADNRRLGPKTSLGRRILGTTGGGRSARYPRRSAGMTDLRGAGVTEGGAPRLFVAPNLILGPIPNAVRSARGPGCPANARLQGISVRRAADYRRLGPKSSLGRRILGTAGGGRSAAGAGPSA